MPLVLPADPAGAETRRSIPHAPSRLDCVIEEQLLAVRARDEIPPLLWRAVRGHRHLVEIGIGLEPGPIYTGLGSHDQSNRRAFAFLPYGIRKNVTRGDVGGQPIVSSSAFAFFRSRVSNPSVNQEQAVREPAVPYAGRTGGGRGSLRRATQATERLVLVRSSAPGRNTLQHHCFVQVDEATHP
jgi:hypothetical protein